MRFTDLSYIYAVVSKRRNIKVVQVLEWLHDQLAQQPLLILCYSLSRLYQPAEAHHQLPSGANQNLTFRSFAPCFFIGLSLALLT